MTFEEFERRAHELFDSIPAELLGGVEYLSVERRTVRHPGMPGVYTLGECATGELDLGGEFGGVERSGVFLYWGSFRRVAADDPAFDWEGELWETLTHEIRHHREAGAGEDALEDFDYAADENFKRRDGEPFDPLFFRLGEDGGGGWREVDGDRFLEREARAGPPGPLLAEVDGRRIQVDPPEEPADVHFLYLDGLTDDDLDTALVLVRRRSAWESLAQLFRRRAPRVLESAAEWRVFGPA